MSTGINFAKCESSGKAKKALSHNNRDYTPNYVLDKDVPPTYIPLPGDRNHIQKDELESICRDQDDRKQGAAIRKDASRFVEGVLWVDEVDFLQVGEEAFVDSMSRYLLEMEKLTGLKVLHSVLHTDEGFSDGVETRRNIHVHILCENIDQIGKTVFSKMNRLALKELQKTTRKHFSEELGFPDLDPPTKPRKRLSHQMYRRMKELENAVKPQIRSLQDALEETKEELDAVKAKKAEERQKMIREGDKIKKDYDDLHRRYADEKAELEAEIEALKTELKAVIAMERNAREELAKKEQEDSKKKPAQESAQKSAQESRAKPAQKKPKKDPGFGM